MTTQQSVPPVDYGAVGQNSGEAPSGVAGTQNHQAPPGRTATQQHEPVTAGTSPPPTAVTNAPPPYTITVTAPPPPDFLPLFTQGVLVGALIVPLALLSVLLWRRLLWRPAQPSPDRRRQTQVDSHMPAPNSTQPLPASGPELLAQLNDELGRVHDLIDRLSGMLAVAPPEPAAEAAVPPEAPPAPPPRSEDEIKRHLKELGQSGTHAAFSNALDFNDFLRINHVMILKLSESGAITPLKGDPARADQDLWAIPDPSGSEIFGVFIGFGLWNSAEYFRANPHIFKQRVSKLFDVDVLRGPLTPVEPAFIRQVEGGYTVVEKGHINL